MNQKGRDFLEKKVTQMFDREVKGLRKPQEPDLEAFILAAIAEGTIVPHDQDTLKKNMKRAALNTAIDFDYSYNNWETGEEEEDDRAWEGRHQQIKISPWAIFQQPPDWKKAIEKYAEDKRVYEEKKAALEAQKEALHMKIQIGSDKMLAPLVDQVDASGNLQILNSRVLFIDEGPKPKQLKS